MNIVTKCHKLQQLCADVRSTNEIICIKKTEVRDDDHDDDRPKAWVLKNQVTSN